MKKKGSVAHNNFADHLFHLQGQQKSSRHRNQRNNRVNSHFPVDFCQHQYPVQVQVLQVWLQANIWVRLQRNADVYRTSRCLFVWFFQHCSDFEQRCAFHHRSTKFVYSNCIHIWNNPAECDHHWRSQNVYQRELDQENKAGTISHYFVDSCWHESLVVGDVFG